MKTVLAYSGGLDATYVLYKLLTETEDEVTAIFIDSTDLTHKDQNKYNIRMLKAGKSEIQDARKTVAELRKHTRNFTFLNKPLEPEFLKEGVQHSNNPAGYFVRSMLPKINDGTYDKLVISNERENDGFSHSGDVAGKLFRPASWPAYDEFLAGAIRGTLSFPLLDTNYNQAHALSTLPSELIAINEPVDTNAFKSVKRRFFRSLLREGKTLQEINKIVDDYSINNGRWMSMKYWLFTYPERPDPKLSWEMRTWPTSIIK